jgi:hypothetical protein
MYTDIDIPYTYSSVKNVITALLTDKVDVVVAKRSQDYYKSLGNQRKFISKFFKTFSRIIFRLPVENTQSGLKGFGPIGKEIYLDTKSNRYLADLEFIKSAGRANASILEVNAELRQGIQIPPLKWSLIIKEFGALIRILFI